MKSDLERAAAVSYLSLVVATFTLLKPIRDWLCDQASASLEPAMAERVDDLLHCPFCVSFWLALVVARGNPVRAFRIAGMAAIPSALVLSAVESE